jgi:hypothetical protein
LKAASSELFRSLKERPSGGSSGGGGISWWDVVKEVVNTLVGLIFTNCDGVVVVDQFEVSSDTIVSATPNPGDVFLMPEREYKTDGGVGCHFSRYLASWGAIRI